MGMYDSIYATAPRCRQMHEAEQVEVQFKLYQRHEPGCYTYDLGEQLNPGCAYTGVTEGIFRYECCPRQVGYVDVVITCGHITALENWRWAVSSDKTIPARYPKTPQRS